MALIIKANGEFEKTEPINGVTFSLEELKKIVGGHIEVDYLPNIGYIVVHEEGKLIGLPLNKTATAIYQVTTGTSDYVVGNVLICHHSQIE